MEIATLLVKIGGDLSGLKRTLGEMESTLQSAAQVGKNVGANLTKFVSLPLLAAGGAAVKLAGDFEMAKTRMAAFLGSAE